MNTNIPDEHSQALQALFLDIVLPGLGQLYLRQWRLGIILFSIFLASFVGLLAAFDSVVQSCFGMFAGDAVRKA
jgi:TM2 domain-containing membrane protein YozV